MTQIPTIARTVELQVTAPNIVDVLSVVQVGQLIQLTVIYDNTANNSKYYDLVNTVITVPFLDTGRINRWNNFESFNM